ncbi:putative polyphosphate/ATP-dependent NAD kinase [Methanolinea mesophila]|uniref:ATP-NAD kinase family protein n=1 Tax=Methanolinea mesophila TaxID=547055 RepID=UPI001AE78990|nr:ATP-NAD kinase family protein [Methanolinea mesophila]MBP1928860.1 putative polyphosphate/ATP-dependent NAD kinase [Methanolinea mesophila]
MIRRIGFLVNPVAGMGGAVGLKGTDGLVEEARARGAVPRAGARAAEVLGRLRGSPYEFLTCAGPMGEDSLREAGIAAFRVVYTPPPGTSREDTLAACRVFVAEGADLVLFCGGDGTARDIYEVTGDTVPILGIPAGVKMFSAVFALTPEAAAEILIHDPASLHLRDAEVMDVDEEAYREGALRTRLIGYARSPYLPGLVQGAKRVFIDQDEDRARHEIARFIAEVILGTPETVYILGPGTTTGEVARELGVEKTLLGFDAVKSGRLVGRDLNERGMRALLAGPGPARLVISVLGAQGSVLGRGTQQVSPAVLRRIGVGNVIVIATPHKLAATPVLFVDTGEPALDAAFGETVQVISGYHIAQRMKLAHPRRVGDGSTPGG